MKVHCGENEILIENVVKEYSDTLYRLAMIRMKNKENAEEVVQDTFLRLITYVKKGKTFSDAEHLKAWLLRVAVNRGKSILSLVWNQRTESMDAVQETATWDTQEDYAYDYVLRLPENYRIAINLFYYEQLSTEQIADIMKAQSSTVRSYLHRGREKLKAMMEADGYVG